MVRFVNVMVWEGLIEHDDGEFCVCAVLKEFVVINERLQWIPGDAFRDC